MRRSGLCVVVLVSLLLGCAAVEGKGVVGPAVATTVGAGSVAAGSVTPRGNVDFPRFPSISPDGSEVVFSWRGDLWKVHVGGGQAVRLTSHPGDDLRSAWSRDGGRIAFDSNRDGFLNLYIMSADGSDITAVTESDVGCQLTGFGVDEDGHEVLTFPAFFEGDFYGSPRPYMISTDGGDILRMHDAFGSRPAVSPDGRRVAFTRGASRWSRRGYRGPDARDVWLYDREDGSFVRVTDWEGNDGQARWAGEDALLFVSDRLSDTANLCRKSLVGGIGECQVLTHFDQNDVRSFDVSADGKTVILAAWDTLYSLRLDKPGNEPVPLVISASEDEADNYRLRSIKTDVREAALSPDGKIMAYVAYGEVFVRNLEEKSSTRRITHSHAREKHIAWSPDGLKLYFVSDLCGVDSIYAATVSLTRGEVKEEFEKATNPPEEEEPAEEDEDAPSSQPSETDEATSQPASGPASQPASQPTSRPTSQPVSQPTSQPTTTPADDEDGNSAGADKDEAKKNADDEKDTGNDEAKGKGKDKDEDKDEETPKELDPKRWHDVLKCTIEDVIVDATNDIAPSPSLDGKLLAFQRGLGDLMVLDLDSGEVRELVPGWDAGIHWAWSPDSRHMAYAQSDMNFNFDIWIVPVDGSKPAVNVTRHPDNDVGPSWSADGKILLFASERVNEEYDVWRVYLDKDLESLTPKELKEYYTDAAKAAKARKPLKPRKKDKDKEEKSSDEDDAEDEAAEDEAVDSEKQNAKKGKKGKEKSQGEAEEADDDESEDEKEDEPKELDLEDAYLRVHRVTKFSGSEGNHLITPGGDRYIFSATIDKPGLFSVKWDGTERKRLGDGSASVRDISLSGDKLVFVSKGRVAIIPPGGGKAEYKDISDRVRIDLQQQSSQKFLEAARVLSQRFYHPTMKGRDWPGLTKKYHALARQTRTANEFNDVGARFIGELNASHLGIYARGSSSPRKQAAGRLGITHRRVAQGYEVLSIVPQSPAAKGPMALKVSDIITAIEFEPFGLTDTVASCLQGRVNKETVLTILRKTEKEQPESVLETDLESNPEPAQKPAPESNPETDLKTDKETGEDADKEMDEETVPVANEDIATSRDVTTSAPADEGPTELNILITPISQGAEQRLKYLAKREALAKLVEEWSDGRVGYIHIAGMGQGELDMFERDLYAAAGGKDGLIIDVRNNGGGWTADRLLSSIMVQKHAYTIPRGGDRTNTDTYPQDRLFIQRYTLPINMLCNEKSFSNAEIVSHAFKTLKRGKLVGQQTYGGVISTGGMSLIDGTFVRLPFRGWYLLDGTDMENNGAVPDILVPQTPEAESRDDDEQLRAAVEDLMERLR